MAKKTLLELRLDRYFKQIVEHPNTWVRIEVYQGKKRPQHKVQKEKEYLITRLMTGLKLVGLNPWRSKSQVMIMIPRRKSTNDF